MARSGSKAMFALITGLAAGVAIGMLFAPDKGSKTRKRVKKRLMGLADDVSEKVETVKSAFGHGEEKHKEEA
jgi:gas vesicle protein